jgi:hypothetical protein
MPTPKTPKETHVRQPEEARAIGGALAEVNPPNEIEVVSVNSYGEREVKVFQAQTYGYALKEVAEELYFDIAEEVKHDVLAETPYPRFKASIFGAKGGDYFTIEIRGRHFTKVLYIKKTRAIYYFGGIVIEGFNIYIPVEAVYSKREKVTYYEVVRSNPAIEEIAKDLEELLEGGEY